MVRGRRKRSFYLAAAVLVACGSHSTTKNRGNGNGETGGSAGRSGASGTTPTEGGEGGEGEGGRGGSDATGGKGASAGSGGVSGSMPVAGASPGGVGAGGSGGVGGVGGRPGGAGGQSSLPLPDGCEARGRQEDTDACYLAAFCDGTPNIANCVRLVSGRWQCSCELQHNDRIYEIDGAPGLQACAVAIGLCSEDTLVLGDETCASTSSESTADYCSLELTCAAPVTVSFARGVQVDLVKYGDSECSREQNNLPFECGCEASGDDVDWAEYGVLAESGADACRPLVDFCMSGREPTFDDSTSCFDWTRITETSSCSLHQVCATPMRLTDDVSLAKLERRYSHCDGRGSSGNDCYCSSNDAIFDFTFGTIPDAQTCTLAIANCDHGAEIEVTGDPECQPTSRTAFGPDSCEADFACEQYATVNGRQIVAQGRLVVACERLESGAPWRCGCASNQDTTIFEFGGADMNAWDVCGTAPEKCLERMDVFVGPYGEFVPPPDPLARQ